MFWLILLIVVAVLCALVLFLVAPAAGRKELRTPFAGRNFAHRGYFGKDQRPPENSLPAFAAAVQNGYGMEMDVHIAKPIDVEMLYQTLEDAMRHKITINTK